MYIYNYIHTYIHTRKYEHEYRYKQDNIFHDDPWWGSATSMQSLWVQQWYCIFLEVVKCMSLKPLTEQMPFQGAQWNLLRFLAWYGKNNTFFQGQHQILHSNWVHVQTRSDGFYPYFSIISLQRNSCSHPNPGLKARIAASNHVGKNMKPGCQYIWICLRMG